MKKGLIIVLALFLITGAMIQGCKKSSNPSPEPTLVPATNTPTPIVWTTGILIDDMDKLADGTPGADNANAIPASMGGPGYWYTYDDLKDVLKEDATPYYNPTPQVTQFPTAVETALANGSYVVPPSENYWAYRMKQDPATVPTFTMTSPGYGGTGYCARITGYVTTQFTYGFAGMGVNLLGVNPNNSKKYVNIFGLTGIRFYAKGDGKDYRIKLPSQSTLFVLGESDNHFGFKFNAPTSWTQINIPLSSFTQESGWGTTVPLSEALKYVDSVQFQTTSQSISFDLSIDNLELY
jgi:hypothetical protein